MKKSLLLAMTMALGITASAYAANPFSDVPAGHWAYDSIDQLVAAGVIEGMGDGTYQGGRAMTRYEMAQIVAKAMAKGAKVEELTKEFAEELDKLGVRVANLEKKSDNMKISGEVRAHYKSYKYRHRVDPDKGSGDHESGLRTRLMLNGQINEDWSYGAMVQNEQAWGDGAANNETEMKRAFIAGKIGGMEVRGGRLDYGFGDGNVIDDDLEADAIVLSYGSKIKVEGVAGNAYDDGLTNKFYGAKIEYAPMDNLNIKAEYVNAKKKAEDGDPAISAKIFDIGATYGMGDFELSAMYIRGSAKEDGVKKEGGKSGLVLGLGYKGADGEEPGSWGLKANYYNQGQQTYIAHAIDGVTEWDEGNGFKGWSLSADCAVAKNTVVTVAYFDTKAKSGSKEKAHVLWSDITFSF